MLGLHVCFAGTGNETILEIARRVVALNAEDNRGPDNGMPAVSHWQKVGIGEALPGCSVPIHFVRYEDGTTRYVFAFPDANPWPHQAMTKREQRRLADDLISVLCGLSCLHGNGIFYGRISDKTFCRRGAVGQEKPVIVCDPALAAKLSDVTGGHAEEKYWFSGRNQKLRPANAVDDLYALGVVLSEFLLGHAAVEKIWKNHPDSNFPHYLLKDVQATTSCDFRLKKLACWLIDLEENSTKKTAEAIGYLRSVSLRTTMSIKVVTGIAAVLVPSFIYIVMNQRIQTMGIENGRLSGKGADLENDVEDRNDKIEDLKGQNAKLEQQIAECVGTPPFPEPNEGAQKNWDSQIVGGTLDETIRKADQWLNDNPSNGDSGRIGEWRDKLKKLADNTLHLEAWFREDKEFRPSVVQLFELPWSDQDEIERISEHVAALNDAYFTWLEWSESANSFGQLQKLQQLMPEGTKKHALGRWLSGVIELKSLKFVFRSGATTAPWDNRHLVSAKAGDGDWIIAAWKWDKWESSETSQSTVTLSDYTHGDPIQIVLEQDIYLYPDDTDVINKTFSGPLAPWKLAIPQELLSSPELPNSGYKMRIEPAPGSIVGPPHLANPPTPIATPAPSDVKDAEPATPAPPVLERPVYDPAEKIP